MYFRPYAVPNDGTLPALGIRTLLADFSMRIFHKQRATV